MAYGGLEALAAGYNGRLREDLAPKPATLLAGLNAGQRTKLSRDQFNAQMQELMRRQQEAREQKAAQGQWLQKRGLGELAGLGPAAFNAAFQQAIQPRAPASPFVKLNDTTLFNKQTGETLKVADAPADLGAWKAIADSNNPGQQVFVYEDDPTQTVVGADGQPVRPSDTRQNVGFENADKLRDEFSANRKEHAGYLKAYNRLRSSLENESGPGAIASVIQFMKTLDPGSVVSAGEQATVNAASGLGMRMQGFVNSLNSGNPLTRQMREQINKVAADAVLANAGEYGEIEDFYRNAAIRSQINPEDVLMAPVKYPEAYEPLSFAAVTPDKTGVPDIDEMDDTTFFDALLGGG